MRKVTAKRKLAVVPKVETLTIEEQIASLHASIDTLVAEHVDKIKEAHPTIPRGMLENLAIARADPGPGCRCGVYKHLFGKKP